MKHLLLLPLIVALFFPTSDLSAQARKIVLFEHFTNASCPPCASQNPLFDQNIRENNKGNYLHLAYHTVWPGRDPMNAYNKEDVAYRVNYYNINAVPSMIMQGNQYRGLPGGITQSALDRVSGETSPLRIRVSESSNGSQRTVHATLTSVGIVPSAALRVRALILESDINYPSPPGTNGERDFPNVFRRFLNTPAGEAFTPASVGESAELSWTYDLEPEEWDTSKVYAVVFAQLDGSKDVLNAGSRMLPDIELVPDSEQYLKGAPSQAASFTGRVLNFGEDIARVRLSLSALLPADWQAAFLVDGLPVEEESEVTIAAGGEVPVEVIVNVGDMPGLAEAAITMSSLDDPALTPQWFSIGLISSVTDLVVNNDNNWGAEGDMRAADFAHAYLDGIALTGSDTHASTALSTFMRAFDARVLDDVRHVYYNAGWAFPALPDDFSRAMTGFLGEGGNLMVAGQDVGWDVFDPNGHGTSVARALYRTGLFSNYVDDGGPENASVTFAAMDPLFGGLKQSALANVYGSNPQGTPYFYPDEIRTSPGGVAIAFYDDDNSRIAGIRGAKNDFKSVYFGFGLEQVGDEDIRNEIMRLTRQWFHGIISSIQYDAAISSLFIGQNYPNPAAGTTTIPLPSAARERSILLFDIT
ncbi:MAG: hypothetical protein KFH87_09975, partial [Bacteroidetes bacterium]|nr:hypothetical protein [Bacteroidota bacterium]